ncbi:MAG: TetR family transcriptional regulator C-terminal domain-containing protein [Elusimicrobia bacterium]|nr:TetR family transcriptional regulator C-terminal domain-containing protein [Elusimicrobiota bacterium]
MSRTPNLEARERILSAAFTLMHARGFNDVSMDDVAAGAGLKKANLFHYYPTKEALGLAVFDYAAAKMRAGMEERFSKGEDPIRLVEGMFSDVAEGMEANSCKGGCFVGNLAQELSDHYEKIRLRVSAHLKDWTNLLAGALERGRAKGYFRKEMKCCESAEAILSLFEGATLVSKANKETQPLDNARKMAVRYLKAYKT